MPDPKYAEMAEKLERTINAIPCDCFICKGETGHSVGPWLQNKIVTAVLSVLSRVALDARIEEANNFKQEVRVTARWAEFTDFVDQRLVDLKQQKDEAEREPF